MAEHSAGIFVVRSTSPYPVWIDVINSGRPGEALRISHKDLPDLIFALQRVQDAIANDLGQKDRWEVGK